MNAPIKHEIRCKPSFSTLFVELMPGQSLVAESDAMASMASSVRMKATFFGGFFAALLRRLFLRESLFVNTFTCESGPAQLVITQPTPGDMVALPLNGHSIYLQPGAFVACESGVELSLSWAGFRSWFNGEGLFRLKASGQGTLWLGAYGAIESRDVQGELVVDSGHLVAYEPALSLNLGLASGVFSSFFGGEGFVSRMRGQGKIYLQTRNIDHLASWTNRHL